MKESYDIYFQLDTVKYALEAWIHYNFMELMADFVAQLKKKRIKMCVFNF